MSNTNTTKENKMSNGTYTITVKPTASNKFTATLVHSTSGRYDTPAMIGPYKTEKMAYSMAVKFAAKVGVAVV